MRPNQHLFRALLIVFVFICTAILAACRAEDEELGIPTIAPEFSVPTALPTFTPLPTLTPIANPTATPELPLRTIVIYDDGFRNGWDFVAEDLFAESYSEIVFDGSAAMQVSPRLAFSKLYIVADSSNIEPIDRDDIINVSFYLYSDSAIAFDDMTITAQGSNANIYWLENDRSAITTSDAYFSETQLAFLGIGTIPEQTWARVEFLPQEQQFDPVYDYFTGFIISNSPTFQSPFLIDRIEILMVDNSS